MYLIIGQGAAGTAAANELKLLDTAAKVTIITEEPDWFYSRIDLPDIIAGKYHPREALLQSAKQFTEKGINYIMDERVTHIMPQEHSVELASGQRLGYRKLLLATGSQSSIPKVAGINSRGVYQLWTMAQAQEICEVATEAKVAIVIGAGLIGLKTALALKKRGLNVTVLERRNKVLPQQLDEIGAEILEDKIKAAGVNVLTGIQVDGIETHDGAAIGIISGTQILPCDLVIVATGIKPNVSLAIQAGIRVASGIVTDEFLQTSVPDIYAAGDVSEVIDILSKRSVLTAGWPAAVEQGIIAGRNMVDYRKTPYPGYLPVNSVEIAGMPLVSAGNVNGDANDDIRTFRKENVYKRVVFTDNTVTGFLFMGDIRQAGVMVSAIARSISMPPQATIGSAFSYADLLEF